MKITDPCSRYFFVACRVALLFSAFGVTLLLTGCDPSNPSAAEQADRASRH